jgi:hypothetical protein
MNKQKSESGESYYPESSFYENIFRELRITIYRFVMVLIQYLLSVAIAYLMAMLASFALKVNQISFEKSQSSHHHSRVSPIFETLLLFSVGILIYNVTETFSFDVFNGPATLVLYALFIKNYGYYNLSLRGLIMTK